MALNQSRQSSAPAGTSSPVLNPRNVTAAPIRVKGRGESEEGPPKPWSSLFLVAVALGPVSDGESSFQERKKGLGQQLGGYPTPATCAGLENKVPL